jgi:hypothetical protein
MYSSGSNVKLHEACSLNFPLREWNEIQMNYCTRVIVKPVYVWLSAPEKAALKGRKKKKHAQQRDKQKNYGETSRGKTKRAIQDKKANREQRQRSCSFFWSVNCVQKG